MSGLPLCPSLRLIQEVVADEFNITRLDILSDRRQRRCARPRQVSMYIARHMTVLSYPVIARGTGDRDHTTVMHAIWRVTKLMDGDPLFRARVNLLMDALARGPTHDLEMAQAAPA